MAKNEAHLGSLRAAGKVRLYNKLRAENHSVAIERENLFAISSEDPEVTVRKVLSGEAKATIRHNGKFISLENAQKIDSEYEGRCNLLNKKSNAILHEIASLVGRDELDRGFNQGILSR